MQDARCYRCSCAWKSFGATLLLVDDLDRRILGALMADGRSSFRSLGLDLALSTSAVKRRVDRLVTRGVIRRFAAVVDGGALGWSVEAFVELTCDGNIRTDRIAAALEHHPEVRGAWTVTGPPDCVVRVQARDSVHLEEILNRLRDQPEFSRTTTTLVLSTLLERPQLAPD